MTEPRWLTKARTYLGQKEIEGRKHNPHILRWWTLIRAPFTDDETPWCAGFVGGVLEEVGIKSARSAWARSYLNWGRPLKAPALGCIAVFTRGTNSGHVGFYVGRRGGNPLILGGNQGNAVSIATYPASRLLGYRWPVGEPIPGAAPAPRPDDPGAEPTEPMPRPQPDDPGVEPIPAPSVPWWKRPFVWLGGMLSGGLLGGNLSVDAQFLWGLNATILIVAVLFLIWVYAIPPRGKFWKGVFK